MGADVTTTVGGRPGKSAYQVAVDNGFVGTEAAWLLSLEGSDGVDGVDGVDGTNGTNGTNGTDGDDGLSFTSGSGAPVAAGNVTGDQYVDSDTGEIYEWDGATWSLTGESFPGAPGAVAQHDGSDWTDENGTVLTAPATDGAGNAIDTANTYIVAPDGTWYQIAPAPGGGGGGACTATDLATYTSLDALALVAQTDNLALPTADCGYRITNVANEDLTGIVAPASPRFLTIYNVGPGDTKLKHENIASAAANRFALENGDDDTIQENGVFTLYYDDVRSRWIVATTNDAS